MRQDYKKTAGRGTKPLADIAREMRASVPKGASGRRSINDYSKMSPADASGAGQIGLNILAVSKSKTSGKGSR